MLIPERFRQELRVHGSPVRVWRAEPSPGHNPGDNYDIMAPGDAAVVWRELPIPAGAKALVRNVNRRVEHPEMGWITVSELQITTMPDEIPISHLDRVLLTTWEFPVRESVMRGVDVLNYGYLSDLNALTLSRVVEITQGTTLYATPADYTIAPTQGTIVWVAGRGPTVGTSYAVDYFHRPLYRFMGGEFDLARPSGFTLETLPGLTAAQMPISGTLQWERAGET